MRNPDRLAPSDLFREYFCRIQNTRYRIIVVMKKDLRISRAVYFDPEKGTDEGTDVTSELSAEIMKGELHYKGIYNNIFPDHFKRIYKRLMVVVEIRGKQYTKYYNENEKINLPSDLGLENKKWWEKTWIQLLFASGAIASLVALFS